MSSEGVKIIFTGLDAAGKTSIILSLMREISKIAIVKPTKSAARRTYDFLGTTISEWDLGGQQRYREDYQKNPKFFDLTDIAIFVIDIQNRVRVDEALNYLKDIIGIFKKLKIEPPIYIFIHKYDPVYASKAYKETNAFIQNLELQIRSISDNKFVFYKTSIYNIPTIVSAMSTVLLNRYPKKHLLDNAIREFAPKFKAEGIELIDNNSLIIASHYKNDEVKEILNSSTHYFLSLNDVLIKPKSSQDSNLMQIERSGYYFLFKQFSLKYGAPPYHLLLLKNDQHFSLEQFNALVKILVTLL